MRCIKCNSEIPDNAKFCPKCGAKVEISEKPAEVKVCPKCGATYPSTAKFCRKDGTPLQELSSVTESPEIAGEEVKSEEVTVSEAERVSAEFVVCPNCGTPQSLTANFCKKCGAPLRERIIPEKVVEVRSERAASAKTSKIPLRIAVLIFVIILAAAGGYLYFSGILPEKITSLIKPSKPAPEKAIPLEAKLNLEQGLNYARAKDWDNAIKEFTLAIEKYPQYDVAYVNRAVAYMHQKKFNKALDDLKKAEEINPNNPTLHYNFVALYSILNQLDRALDHLDKALELGFNNYDALRNDPDLANVRKHPEFRKICEKHKVFLY